MGTELGNIQLMDPDDGSLVLVTQFGFGTRFLDHFAVVDDSGSVCGQAAQQCAQAVVADVQDDPACMPHRSVFRAAGVRAVQSTPLVDRAGRMIGMISTHQPKPDPPSEQDLLAMALYSQLAGEIIARHLGRAAAVQPPLDPSTASADAVNQIFAAGLNFTGALPLITDDLAAQRVRDGISSLDETIRTIQLAVLNIVTDRDSGRRG